ncbi:MAG: hypothetical protein IT559_01625 [Alphaproteobacteria bacterium]|nr:hypothetical protein [Alphaproteobacteria bacterium]
MLKENPALTQEEKIIARGDLQNYFFGLASLSYQISMNKVKKGFMGFSSGVSALATAFAAVSFSVSLAKTTNEIEVLSTSPDLYLQNRPHLVEEFEARCATQGLRGHVINQEKKIKEDVRDFIKKMKETPSENHVLTSDVAGYVNPTLEGCVDEEALKHADSLAVNRALISVGAVVPLSVFIGVGVYAWRLRREPAAKIAKNEEELLGKRANVLSASEFSI